jgi:hypothetical protein
VMDKRAGSLAVVILIARFGFSNRNPPPRSKRTPPVHSSG